MNGFHKISVVPECGGMRAFAREPALKRDFHWLPMDARLRRAPPTKVGGFQSNLVHRASARAARIAAAATWSWRRSEALLRTPYREARQLLLKILPGTGRTNGRLSTANDRLKAALTVLADILENRHTELGYREQVTGNRQGSPVPEYRVGWLDVFPSLSPVPCNLYPPAWTSPPNTTSLLAEASGTRIFRPSPATSCRAPIFCRRASGAVSSSVPIVRERRSRSNAFAIGKPIEPRWQSSSSMAWKDRSSPST